MKTNAQMDYTGCIIPLDWPKVRVVLWTKELVPYPHRNFNEVARRTRVMVYLGMRFRDEIFIFDNEDRVPPATNGPYDFLIRRLRPGALRRALLAKGLEPRKGAVEMPCDTEYRKAKSAMLADMARLRKNRNARLRRAAT